MTETNQQKDKAKQYREDHKEEIKERKKKYREEHKEEIKLKSKPILIRIKMNLKLIPNNTNLSTKNKVQQLL